MLCITLGSCISIESNIILKNDGSGSISLTYRVSPGMKELGRIGDEVKPLPLPIYKEDFEKLLDDYYDERGWDVETGTPTPNKLEELGLGGL